MSGKGRGPGRVAVLPLQCSTQLSRGPTAGGRDVLGARISGILGPSLGQTQLRTSGRTDGCVPGPLPADA